MRNEQVRITGEEIAIHIQTASEEVKHTEIVKVSDEARNKHRRSGKDNKWKRNFNEQLHQCWLLHTDLCSYWIKYLLPVTWK